jgi:hypothetical protein
MVYRRSLLTLCAHGFDSSMCAISDVLDPGILQLLTTVVLV